MKKILALVLALCMVFALCACGQQATTAATTDTTAAAPVENTSLTFATGGESGTYYAYGSVLAQYITTAVDGLDITAVVGNGSKANVEDLDADAAQLAFCQSDVMSYAYEGTNLFEAPVTSFSVLSALYMEDVQIVTLDPDIKTVADLKGKTVSIGASGSGVYFNALDCLAAYDMTLDDIIPQYLSFGDSAENLKDHKIDAAFIVAGAPTTAVTDLATGNSVSLVSLDDEHIAKLIEMSPYYVKHTIPAGTYDGQTEDATTVAVEAVVLVRNDVSEDAVYNICAAMFNNKEAIAEQHAKGENLDIDFASSITNVPYHPGAAKFFAEQGVEGF